VTENELIKAVFGNAKGEELLNEWKKVYGDRISYDPSHKPEDTAYFEGQRSFYLVIEQILGYR